MAEQKHAMRCPPESGDADHVLQHSTSLYERVESYPWATDPDFQSGLIAILGSNNCADQSQVDDLTLLARCFYYERKYGVKVDKNSYTNWRSQRPSSSSFNLAPNPSPIAYPSSNSVSPSSTTFNTPTKLKDSANRYLPMQNEQIGVIEGDSNASNLPEYPATFEQVMELIKSGKPIPGIKEIPDTVLVGQGTEATKTKRPKPWERKDLDNTSTSTTWVDAVEQNT